MSRKKASKIAIMLLIISLFSKLLGFVRDMLIARSFGVGMETDVYFIALITSTILFTIIGLSLNTTIIPMISTIRDKEGSIGELIYVNNIVNVVFLFTILITGLGYVFAPIIVKILASGFTGEKFELAVKMTRIGMPIMIFYGFFYILKGYLHVHGNFKIPAFEGILMSIPIIIYLVFFSSTYGIVGLMSVTTSTGLFRIALVLPSSIKNGYKYKKVFNLKDIYFRNTLVLIGPIILGTMSSYINTIVDRTIASRLIEGSVSALSYAVRVRGIVIGLFVLSLTTVLYPMISEFISNKDEKELIHMLKFGLNSIMIITIPTTVGLMVLNYPITKLLFERGSFSNIGTLMTSSALFYYSLGIVGVGVTDLLSKVYFAMQDTKTPMKISVFAVGINIILNLMLSKYMGHDGLALATSVAATFSAIMLLVALRKKINNLGIKENFYVFTKSVVASIIMGTVVFILYSNFNIIDGSALVRGIKLIVIIVIGVVVYGTSICLLKVKEVELVIGMVRRR